MMIDTVTPGRVFSGMTVVDRWIPDADAAVEYTARDRMCGLALRDSLHPGVRELARRLAYGRTDVDAAHAAFDYVVRTIPYRKDPEGIELVQAPIYTLGVVRPVGYRPQGDCDCMCAALGALVLAMGFGVQYRVIAWYDWPFSHVNPIIVLPSGQQLICDPVMGRLGWNRQKEKIIRQKIYECPMLIRSLEDKVMPDDAPSNGASLSALQGLRRMRNQLARAVAVQNSQRGLNGLSGCKCGCGSRRRRGGKCCGGAPNRANNQSGGVVVNVSPNFGTQDSRRFTDASRFAYDGHQSDRSRNFQMSARDDGASSVREVAVSKPYPVAIPGPVVDREVRVPVMVRMPDESDPEYKEFY